MENCKAKSESIFSFCILREYRIDSGILRTSENTNMILAPEGLQNIGGRQRNPKDVVYPSAIGQIKRKAKPEKGREKQGHAVIERTSSGVHTKYF